MTDIGADQPTGINPYDLPLAYRHAVIGDTLTPGLLTEIGGNNPRKWDERDGTGISGSTVVYGGQKCAKFTIKIQLGWGLDGRTPAQEFADWTDFCAAELKPPTTKVPDAKFIFHPMLEALPIPIRAVVIEDVTALKPVLDMSIFEAEIQCLEYRKPAPAAAQPKAAGGSKATPPDATDQMISNLTNQLNELAK